MKVYYLLVSAFCVWCHPVHSQFYYSPYTPFATPYTSIFPQPYFPGVPQVSVPQVAVPQVASTVTYNLPPVENNARNAEYRGFGYRTDYKDGATATVFFVTGAEADLLRNFPNIQTQNSNEAKARNLASDILDNNAITDVNGHIRNILQPADIQMLFDKPNMGVLNFYTYPAGTVPLTRQLSNDTESVTTESNTTTTTSTTTAPTTTTEEEESEAEAAESMVKDTRVLPNTIEENKNSTENDSVAVTVASTESSTEISSTTDEPSTTAKEAATPEITTKA